MSSVHTRNSAAWPDALRYTSCGLSSNWPLPGRLEHVSRVAHSANPVQPELHPMVGVGWHAPDDDVACGTGLDERRSEADRLLAFLGFLVVDIGDVMLGDAAFERMDSVLCDR